MLAKSKQSSAPSSDRSSSEPILCSRCFRSRSKSTRCSVSVPITPKVLSVIWLPPRFACRRKLCLGSMMPASKDRRPALGWDRSARLLGARAQTAVDRDPQVGEHLFADQEAGEEERDPEELAEVERPGH